MPLEGAPSTVPAPGQVLGRKYLIQRLLGEGGMAFVFEANHQRLGQRVALKLLVPDLARDPELVARFEREARALALLRSRHVARVIDVDATLDGLPYIVMEFLEGRDLDAELRERKQLPYDEAIDYVLQACAGMAEAHGAGVVHRDLKPANLFVAEDNGERIVKVLDFGISKVVGESTRLTGSGAVMGTVLYMSPEQIRATQDVDTRADIWSLGMILFELVAGRPPWEGGSHQIAAAIVSTDAPDIRSYVHTVPEPVATAIRTTLARDRNQRFASVRELAAALAPFAPPGSLGAAVAEQLMTGQSSPRLRPSYASVSGPSLPPVSSPHPSLVQRDAPSLTGMPAPANDESRPRAFVAIGAVLGVLAAIGMVLMFVAIGARRHNAPAPDPSSSSAASAARAPPPAPAPVPATPPTGVVAAASTPTASATVSATGPRRPSLPIPTPSATTATTRPTVSATVSATVTPASTASNRPPAFL